MSGIPSRISEAKADTDFMGWAETYLSGVYGCMVVMPKWRENEKFWGLLIAMHDAWCAGKRIGVLEGKS